MLLILQGPIGPFSPKSPGMHDIIRDLRRWYMHDGPSPPNVVNFRPVVMMLTYLILSTWAALDPIYLSYAFCVVLRPVQITASCWLASWFLDPKRTLCTTIRVGQWALNQPLYYVPFYGVTAYVLSLRGQSYAVEVFSFACLVAGAAWTTMSAPTKFKFSMVAVIPAMFAFLLITLPFAPVWCFRQTLKVPYFWAKQRVL
jgi:hypothetical protein